MLSSENQGLELRGLPTVLGVNVKVNKAGAPYCWTLAGPRIVWNSWGNLRPGRGGRGNTFTEGMLPIKQAVGMDQPLDAPVPVSGGRVLQRDDRLHD